MEPNEYPTTGNEIVSYLFDPLWSKLTEFSVFPLRMEQGHSANVSLRDAALTHNNLEIDKKDDDK